jgi:hypothetical protein
MRHEVAPVCGLSCACGIKDSQNEIFRGVLRFEKEKKGYKKIEVQSHLGCNAVSGR